MEYEFFRKQSILPEDDIMKTISSELFISAYNTSDRVKNVFEKVTTAKKIWLIFPEYNFQEYEFPPHTYHQCSEESEDLQIANFFIKHPVNLNGASVAIDITGFPRPQLAFLVKFLKFHKVSRIEFIYSEPIQYKQKETTEFSFGDLKEVRQIKGYEGNHLTDVSKDYLIIGSGFDSNQIRAICNSKEHANIYQMLGFPSLRPDMYQQNLLKTIAAESSLGEKALMEPIFAPANDPFITAKVLSDFCKNKGILNGQSNLYLSPLSTKTQTLGFIIYFLFELENTSSSMIFPFFSNYEKETSIGLHKINYFRIDLI